MIRSYKYRLYPNKEQAKKLEKTLEICRHVYNTALQERIWYYKETKKMLSYYDQDGEMRECRNQDEELLQVNVHVLRNVLHRVDYAYQNFFRKLKNPKIKKKGFPRFKSKDRYRSFICPINKGNVDVLRNNDKHIKLKIPSIGSIKMRYSRLIPEESKIKNYIVIRKNNKWYACFTLELSDVKQKEKFENSIALDLGLENYATLNTGKVIENQRYYQKSQERLKIESQKLSKKKDRITNNYKKQKQVVTNIYEKISNQRQDNLHKLSRKLVNKYDLIVVEDLEIQNMLENNKYPWLNKSIADASWATFVSMLTYKAEEAGNLVVKVDPRGTSQICSSCGNLVPKDLWTRIHKCPYCGLEIPRDVNSAIEVLNRGLSASQLALSRTLSSLGDD